jgi:hypothetical protein
MTERKRRAKAPDISKEVPVDAVPTGHGQRLNVSTIYANSEKMEDVITDDKDTIEVRRFLTEPARVTVRGGVTKALDKYEFLRVDVEITTPCYVEEIDACFDETAELVATKLDEEVDNYMGDQD